MYFWKEYVYILLYKKIMYGVYNFEEYLYILHGSKSIYSHCCAHIYSLLISWDWSIYRSKHSPAECSNSIYNVDANWYAILRHLQADKSYLNWTYMHSLQDSFSYKLWTCYFTVPYSFLIYSSHSWTSWFQTNQNFFCQVIM